METDAEIDPERDAEGRIATIVGVAQDVTEQRTLLHEVEVRARQERCEHAVARVAERADLDEAALFREVERLVAAGLQHADAAVVTVERRGGAADLDAPNAGVVSTARTATREQVRVAVSYREALGLHVGEVVRAVERDDIARLDALRREPERRFRASWRGPIRPSPAR